MRLETPAVAQLINRILNNGANLEDLERTASYMMAASEYDKAQIKLYEIAERTDVKELVEKYIPKERYYGVKPRSGRYPWFDVSGMKVGDKIIVDLKDLGKFEATVHEITDESVLFIFDDCITKRPMNEHNTNAGGYENSDLKKWIETDLLDKFPAELKARLTELTIPTIGQIFGWDDWNKEHFEADGDEQLSLMQLRKNRVAYFDNGFGWAWLRNSMKKEYSPSFFATVNSAGCMGYNQGSGSGGVRPGFRIIN